jgi:spermidine synthase
MKPFLTIGEAVTPDGGKLTLHQHDGEFYLKLNARQLMSTTSTFSELLLADLSCEGLHGRTDARVVIGGLGLGFSLQRVLGLAGRHAKIQVAELLPEVVEWNRQFLRGVNGAALEDRRVEVIVDDVFRVLREAPADSYDAILLDVDNGPTSLVQKGNSRLYDRRGLGIIKRALKPNGKVAFWSACPEPAFVQSLKEAGFNVDSFPAKAHERAKRAAHMIYVAQRREPPKTAGAPAAPRNRA